MVTSRPSLTTNRRWCMKCAYCSEINGGAVFLRYGTGEAGFDVHTYRRCCVVWRRRNKVALFKTANLSQSSLVHLLARLEMPICNGGKKFLGQPSFPSPGLHGLKRWIRLKSIFWVITALTLTRRTSHTAARYFTRAVGASILRFILQHRKPTWLVL